MIRDYTVVRMDKKIDVLEITMMNLTDVEAPLIKAEVSVFNGIQRAGKRKKIYTTRVLVPSSTSETKVTNKASDGIKEIAERMAAACYEPDGEENGEDDK